MKGIRNLASIKQLRNNLLCVCKSITVHGVNFELQFLVYDWLD